MKLGLTASDIRRVIWSAVFAFLAVFVPLAAGLGDYHNFEEVKAAGLALIPAALAAGFSVVKNGLLADSSPVK